jgi:hypothetical protein
MKIQFNGRWLRLARIVFKKDVRLIETQVKPLSMALALTS